MTSEGKWDKVRLPWRLDEYELPTKEGLTSHGCGDDGRPIIEKFDAE
jgi:hypothetical protein